MKIVFVDCFQCTLLSNMYRSIFPEREILYYDNDKFSYDKLNKYDTVIILGNPSVDMFRRIKKYYTGILKAVIFDTHDVSSFCRYVTNLSLPHVNGIQDVIYDNYNGYCHFEPLPILTVSVTDAKHIKKMIGLILPGNIVELPVVDKIIKTLKTIMKKGYAVKCFRTDTSGIRGRDDYFVYSRIQESCDVIIESDADTGTAHLDSSITGNSGATVMKKISRCELVIVGSFVGFYLTLSAGRIPLIIKFNYTMEMLSRDIGIDGVYFSTNLISKKELYRSAMRLIKNERMNVDRVRLYTNGIKNYTSVPVRDRPIPMETVHETVTVRPPMNGYCLSSNVGDSWKKLLGPYSVDPGISIIEYFGTAVKTTAPWIGLIYNSNDTIDNTEEIYIDITPSMILCMGIYTDRSEIHDMLSKNGHRVYLINKPLDRNIQKIGPDIFVKGDLCGDICGLVKCGSLLGKNGHILGNFDPVDNYLLPLQHYACDDTKNMVMDKYWKSLRHFNGILPKNTMTVMYENDANVQTLKQCIITGIPVVVLKNQCDTQTKNCRVFPVGYPFRISHIDDILNMDVDDMISSTQKYLDTLYDREYTAVQFLTKFHLSEPLNKN